MKIAVSWSGGKDSALALYKLMQDSKYVIDHLFTIFDEDRKCAGMHGIPMALVEEQAKAIGIPLKKLYLSKSLDHANYEEVIIDYYSQLRSDGISQVMHGDIFLEDLKEYRDHILARESLKGVYPLWQQDTARTMQEFLELGFKTVTCAVKTPLLSGEQVGQQITHNWLQSLGPDVDPCGENGEFHTFVVDGPIFRYPVAFRLGDKIEKKDSYKSLDKSGHEVEHETLFYFQEIGK